MWAYGEEPRRAPTLRGSGASGLARCSTASTTAWFGPIASGREARGCTAGSRHTEARRSRNLDGVGRPIRAGSRATKPLAPFSQRGSTSVGGRGSHEDFALDRGDGWTAWRAEGRGRLLKEFFLPKCAPAGREQGFHRAATSSMGTSDRRECSVQNIRCGLMTRRCTCIRLRADVLRLAVAPTPSPVVGSMSKPKLVAITTFVADRRQRFPG